MARKHHKHIGNPVIPIPPLPLRTAAYLRIPEVKPELLSESIEDHLKIIKAFLVDRPNLTLTATYTDVNIGDGCFPHDGFQQMIRAAEGDEIDCVIVKDISSLGRSPIEIGYYIEKCSLLHIHLISISDQIESAGGISDGSYADHLRNQIVLLQHEICEVDLQIERQEFLIKSLESNVQKGIITSQEGEGLRSIFELRQSELAEVQDQLLKRIQWFKEATTSECG